MVPVTIVLASYRGAQYIGEQIESIQAQTHCDWRLLVRDDASEDTTREVVRDLAAEDPRIEIVEDDLGRLGAVGNFSLLLERALLDGADWVALCDQDDHWLPHKLERQLEWIQRLGSPPDRPLLLHADMVVVDPHLEPIHPSLHGLMGLHHEERTPLATLLIQNFVTGCSCLVNRALLEIALPVPRECVMYDWWLAQCAAACGGIAFQAEPLLLYRQHPGNVIGARPIRKAIRDLILRTVSGRRHDPEEFMHTLRQAVALEQRLASHLSIDPDLPSGMRQLRESLGFVSRYLDLHRPGAGRLRRVLALHRQGIRRQKALLDATFKLKMLTTDVDPTRIAKRAPLEFPRGSLR